MASIAAAPPPADLPAAAEPLLHRVDEMVASVELHLLALDGLAMPLIARAGTTALALGESDRYR